MLDFTNVPFFDNHTHRIDVSNRTITPLDLGIAFMHGWGPINDESQPLGRSAEVENCTPEYEMHVMNMPVVKVCVNLLSKRFGCEATPEAVIAERNKLTSVDGYGYAKSLYEDGKIVGEMVDDGAAFGDHCLDCFPTKIYRLFQMDPYVRGLIKECASFAELKQTFDAGIRAKLAEGFIGLKSHLLEIRSQAIRVIEDAEAEACYAKAQAGDKLAFEDVYLAIFEHVLIMTQELGFSVHVHTGCTGNPNDLQTNTDPYAIAPLMRDHRYYRGCIVFLHGNPPDFRHDAWVTHCYPNVWMDLGWSLPWLSLNMEQIIDEVLGMAPSTKVMFGTGQHNHAEMAWTSAKVAKSALANVLNRKVEAGLLSEAQAQEIGEQLLYKNAARLYKLDI